MLEFKAFKGRRETKGLGLDNWGLDCPVSMFDTF